MDEPDEIIARTGRINSPKARDRRLVRVDAEHDGPTVGVGEGGGQHRPAKRADDPVAEPVGSISGGR